MDTGMAESYRTSQIELVIKLLILRLFDLLANDNRNRREHRSSLWQVGVAFSTRRSVLVSGAYL